MMPPVCRCCRAMHGTLVTRQIRDPEKWALDVDLAEEFPRHWGPPHWVKVNIDRCETCSRPLGLRESA